MPSCVRKEVRSTRANSKTKAEYQVSFHANWISSWKHFRFYKSRVRWQDVCDQRVSLHRFTWSSEPQYAEQLTVGASFIILWLSLFLSNISISRGMWWIFCSNVEVVLPYHSPLLMERNRIKQRHCYLFSPGLKTWDSSTFIFFSLHHSTMQELTMPSFNNTFKYLLA